MVPVQEVHASPATLVVVPVSLLLQWEKELHTKAPNLKVIRYYGPDKVGRTVRDHFTLPYPALHYLILSDKIGRTVKDIFYPSLSYPILGSTLS